MGGINNHITTAVSNTMLFSSRNPTYKKANVRWN